MRSCVGLYPYFFSNWSISVARIARDIGPNCAVPEMSAGGAVDEPLPSTWIFTFGYILAKASPHSVMRLFMVSEPVLDRLPETPDAFW